MSHPMTTAAVWQIEDEREATIYHTRNHMQARLNQVEDLLRLALSDLDTLQSPDVLDVDLGGPDGTDLHANLRAAAAQVRAARRVLKALT